MDKVKKIQSCVRGFLVRNQFATHLVSALTREYRREEMEKSFLRLHNILQRYPPHKDENKFIYGKLVELEIIQTLNRFFPCHELDSRTGKKQGSEYKNDVCFPTFRIKFSIKATKNGSSITIINKRHSQRHSIRNMGFIIMNFRSSSLYIFRHNRSLDPFLHETGSTLNYRSSLFRFLEKHFPQNIYRFPQTPRTHNYLNHLSCHGKEEERVSKKKLEMIQSEVETWCSMHPPSVVEESGRRFSWTFIDLFCGIGGFHVALKRLGARCVWACDIDKDCRRVYEDNFGIRPHSDIRTVSEQEIPDFDILCAGFPCQSFSNAGKKKAREDHRGLLFDEIIRIARCKRPRFMFLENVKHIRTVDQGRVFFHIQTQIRSIGYRLYDFDISPHEYGIPQQRKRVYFVCIRQDLPEIPVVILPPEKPSVVVSDFLLSQGEVPERYFLQGDLLYTLNAWDEMIQTFQVGEKISPTILIHDAYRDYTPEQLDQREPWRKEYMDKNKVLLDKYQSEWDAWYERHRSILSQRQIYGKLEWQVGKIRPNDSLFHYFIQIRQSGIRVKKPDSFPTLVAISQIPIYGPEKRYITPRECARLQSFPDSFRWLEDDRITYKQLGNSVNVENVYTILHSTLSLYENTFC